LAVYLYNAVLYLTENFPVFDFYLVKILRFKQNAAPAVNIIVFGAVPGNPGCGTPRDFNGGAIFRGLGILDDYFALYISETIGVILYHFFKRSACFICACSEVPQYYYNSRVAAIENIRQVLTDSAY
jgi:hypothetical protein